MIAYAGIGSRETPTDVLAKMQDWGNYLASIWFVLRSGRARGADQWFELGCDTAPLGHQVKQIFTADMSINHPAWLDHAAEFHPAWSKCSEYARLLHARNSAIMLGANLNDPVRFVVCWTKDGKASGGTGQALRIADAYKIPVFNLFLDDAQNKLREYVRQVKP